MWVLGIHSGQAEWGIIFTCWPFCQLKILVSSKTITKNRALRELVQWIKHSPHEGNISLWVLCTQVLAYNHSSLGPEIGKPKEGQTSSFPG